MEKYSKWRDPGTGIQPFLPTVPPRRDPSLIVTFANGFLSIVGPILGILKLLIIIILGLFYFLLVEVVGFLLLPSAIVYRVWHRGTTSVFIRLILAFLGFWWIRAEVVSLKRGRGHTTQKKIANTRPGDVIVANWVSYVDILYLAYKYDPVFTQFYASTCVFCPISFWQAIRITGVYPELEPPEGVKARVLKDIVTEARKNGRPIVVFPEGTTSNGRALLKFAPVFAGWEIPVRDVGVHVLAFRYDFERFSPAYTVDSKLVHFFRMCSQFSNTLIVKALATSESPSSSNFSIPPTSSTSSVSPSSSVVGNSVTSELAATDPLGAQIMTLLGAIARLRKTGMGVEDKRDFLEFYWMRTRGYIKKD